MKLFHRNHQTTQRVNHYDYLFKARRPKKSQCRQKKKLEKAFRKVLSTLTHFSKPIEMLLIVQEEEELIKVMAHLKEETDNDENPAPESEKGTRH